MHPLLTTITTTTDSLTRTYPYLLLVRVHTCAEEESELGAWRCTTAVATIHVSA